MPDLIDQLIRDWNLERPDLDPSPMAVVGRILKLGKTLEKSAGKALQQSGIHYTDLDVMATLRRSGKPYELTPTQLMKAVLISSGAMTALLDRLVKLELIYRSPDPGDRRIIRAGLTPKGKKIIDEAIERCVLRKLRIPCKALNKAERETLAALLKEIVAFFRNVMIFLRTGTAF